LDSLAEKKRDKKMASWAQMAAVAAGAPEPPPPVFTRLRVQQQTEQQARAVHQPQGENERVFLAAVDHCFARWSLLRLAVDMGWGDGGGAHNIQLLKEETLEWLQRRRAAQAEPSDLEEVGRASSFNFLTLSLKKETFPFFKAAYFKGNFQMEWIGDFNDDFKSLIFTDFCGRGNASLF
jgi:hypothetical protein